MRYADLAAKLDDPRHDRVEARRSEPEIGGEPRYPWRGFPVEGGHIGHEDRVGDAVMRVAGALTGVSEVAAVARLAISAVARPAMDAKEKARLSIIAFVP